MIKRKFNKKTGLWETPNSPCPYKVRDLSKDECYSGGGRNRCQYFSRYVFDEKHPGSIEYRHPANVQYEFNFRA